jgi:Domain of unknown function (DUF4118)
MENACPRNRSISFRAGICIATVLGVAGIGELLRYQLGSDWDWGDWAIAFVALAAINTAWFGRRAGLVTTVASAVIYNYLFSEPFYAFSVPQATEYLLWASMIGCALFMRPAMKSWLSAEGLQVLDVECCTALEYRNRFSPGLSDFTVDLAAELARETAEARKIAAGFGLTGVPVSENAADTLAFPEWIWMRVFKEE